MALDDDLRQQLAELSARVASLETVIASLVTGAQGQPKAHPEPAVRAPLRVEKAPPARAGSSLESRIGAQLLNRIGILAVLIGVAWFLKLAFDRNWIGPSVRVWIGLAVAIGLMVWSQRFHRQGFPAFSYSLKALGTSIAYLSLWAASSVFHLAPSWLIFVAMTAVTVANAVLARRLNSELLGIYALAGGLATPGLLSMERGDEVFLFLYLALLNAGALLLLARHPWRRMAWVGLLGTATYYLGWAFTEDDPSRWFVTVLFLALFFAAFAAVPLLILRTDKSGVVDSFFPVAFPIVNAVATWWGLMVLLGGRGQQSGRPWATVALAGACLAVAATSRAPAKFSHTNLGLGVLFVTVAVPLEFHGCWATLCWLGEALALVALAKTRSSAALRIFATAVLAVAAYSLLVDWIAGTPQPLTVVANLHFVTNLVAAAIFATTTILSLGAGPAWKRLAVFSAIAFSLTLLVAVSLEIHHYWFCGAGFLRDFCYGYGQLERRTIAAGWSYSAWWMLYGAALMAAGFLRRSAFLRWQALVVLGLSIAKVFLNGVTLQSQAYRVLSFLALGVLLLAISFAYQRDWLRLRG
jgi:uncharacterized membrane protein